MTNTPIKVLTLNCNGQGSKIKAKRILSVLHKSQADILFLQETHCKDATHPIFNSKRFPTQLTAAGSSKSQGVAILLLARLRFQIESVKKDERGRYLFANVLVEDEPMTLASLYAPNVNSVHFVASTLAELKAFSTGPILIGGDLNCISNARLDYSGKSKA